MIKHFVNYKALYTIIFSFFPIPWARLYHTATALYLSVVEYSSIFAKYY